MTLHSRHRIRNSSPDGLRPITPPFGHVGSHNIESLRVRGEETFCFFENRRQEWGSNLWTPTFQAGSFNQCTRAPPAPSTIPINLYKLTQNIWFVTLWQIIRTSGIFSFNDTCIHITQLSQWDSQHSKLWLILNDFILILFAKLSLMKKKCTFLNKINAFLKQTVLLTSVFEL